jgi:regulator of sigma E protease
VTGTAESLANLFRGRGSAQVSGPVGIVRASQQYLQVGIQWYLMLLGLISMSIALFNFLPFLPLDGGNILVAVVEGIRGRPLPRGVYQRASAVGTALMVLVFLFAFAHDIGGTRG